MVVSLGGPSSPERMIELYGDMDLALVSAARSQDTSAAGRFAPDATTEEYRGHS